MSYYSSIDPPSPNGNGRHTPRLDPAPTRPNGVRDEGPVLITGGAGFVGTNLAHRLLMQRRPVTVFDNLSRPGVEANARWLRHEHGHRVQLDIADVRDADALRRAVRDATVVFHFAGQVAVTTSLTDPVHDFEVNARGTLNLLEAIRACDRPPRLLFTSTNKVYGSLKHLDLKREATRYAPVDDKVHRAGINGAALSFHSPYGCSKGTADQYVLDYARTFGIPATVFRMSCIYGPHQCGTEDQGWVAHFIRCALMQKQITLYGDGRQVRDILFVEDLVDAMLLAIDEIERTQGQAFNIGGGPDNTLSLLELLDLIEDLHGSRPPVHHDAWRSGDQRYYVSDIRRFRRATGWVPRVGVRDGVARLYEWLAEHRAAPMRVTPSRSAV